MKNTNLSLAGLTKSLRAFIRTLNRYKTLLFFLTVASLYGFIVWRINAFSNVPASTSEETAQTNAQPHIDQATIDKLQNLQDNSVSVQSLFDQARDNPFQE